jgi:hypothetical protein
MLAVIYRSDVTHFGIEESSISDVKAIERT